MAIAVTIFSNLCRIQKNKCLDRMKNISEPDTAAWDDLPGRARETYQYSFTGQNGLLDHVFG
jgi:hypothetical protein